MHCKTTLLSEGSSSLVFLTEDPQYVIKEYKSFYSYQSRMKEVQILELLKGDHIVKLIEYTENYLILERLQNKDLFEKVKTQELNTQLVKEISKTLIKILDRVHTNMVVHRDIKLENLLIDNTGRLVLCDFGLAELLTECSVRRTVGTLNYMAPELHSETLLGSINSENINTQGLVKCDIFALGVTFFQLILGFLPFQSTKPSGKCKLWRLIQQKKWNQYWLIIQKLSKQQIEPVIKDFLEQFLSADSSARTTLQSIYNHPYLQDVKDDAHLI